MCVSCLLITRYVIPSALPDTLKNRHKEICLSRGSMKKCMARSLRCASEWCVQQGCWLVSAAPPTRPALFPGRFSELASKRPFIVVLT